MSADANRSMQNGRYRAIVESCKRLKTYTLADMQHLLQLETNNIGDAIDLVILDFPELQ
jgi:hypothetical protein